MSGKRFIAFVAAAAAIASVVAVNANPSNTIPRVSLKHHRDNLAASSRKYLHTSTEQFQPGWLTSKSHAGAEPNITYKTEWFTQYIDHFTWANQHTYQQRYLINKDHWCGTNCPILFYCGNEGDIEVFARNTGWMWENAANLHAMIVFAEHRFYGKSMPYPIDPTKVTPNDNKRLGYLSSEQALADYAHLIYELKNTIYDAKYSPVIAIGGSYGGMLAAWMRMKYPNSVTGALAGSAPILQFVGEYECSQFMRIVTKDFENYSSNCSRSIAKSWSVIRNLARDAYGLTQVGNMFRTCDALQPYDVESLLGMLSNIWVNMAMTDYANPADFLSKMPAYPIKHVCEALSRDPDSLDDRALIEAVAKASQVYTNYTGQAKCLDLYAIVNDPMDVMWDFQACTEMIMPICSDGVNDMFEPQSFNVTAYTKDCKRRWGVTSQKDKVRTLYGDADMNSYTNIIFSSCSRDPWSAGCPQQSVAKNSIHAIKIPGVCHHEDLRASGPGDSEPLKKARQDELNIISDWISKHYEGIKATRTNGTLQWRYAISV